MSGLHHRDEPKHEGGVSLSPKHGEHSKGGAHVDVSIPSPKSAQSMNAHTNSTEAPKETPKGSLDRVDHDPQYLDQCSTVDRVKKFFETDNTDCLSYIVSGCY